MANVMNKQDTLYMEQEIAADIQRIINHEEPLDKPISEYYPEELAYAARRLVEAYPQKENRPRLVVVIDKHGRAAWHIESV